jgi:hypothetical protein
MYVSEGVGGAQETDPMNAWIEVFWRGVPKIG